MCLIQLPNRRAWASRAIAATGRSCCGLKTENRRACSGQRIGRKRYLRSTTGAEKHEAGDMTPDEGEEGGIWKLVGIFAMAAGVMVLICSIVAFITWCWSRRS